MSQTRRHAQTHGARQANHRALTLTSSNATVHSTFENQQIMRSHASRSPTNSLFGGDNIEDDQYHPNYSRHYPGPGQPSNAQLIPPAGIASQLLQDMRNEIEYLRRRVTEQDGEISRLRHEVGRSEGLKDAYDKLLQELDAMRTRIVAHDPEYGVPLGPQLDQADYKFVKYWFSDDFKDGEMILDLDDEVYDGKLGFIEDERGRFVGVRIVNNITTLARLIFCQFVELGIWPRYWRRISIRAFSLFAMRLYESYPFLRLCAGDWKVRAIGRDQYSGWFNKNPELKALAATSNLPDLEEDDEEDEVVPARPKRRAVQDGSQRPRKKQRTAAIQQEPVASPPPQPGRLLTPPPARMLTAPPATPPPPASPLSQHEPALSPAQNTEHLALILMPSRNGGTPTPRSPGRLSPQLTYNGTPPRRSPGLSDIGVAHRRLIAPIPQRLASPAREATPPSGASDRSSAARATSPPRPPAASTSLSTPAATSRTSATTAPTQSSDLGARPSSSGAPKGRIPPPLARAIAERQRLTKEQETRRVETAPMAPVDARNTDATSGQFVHRAQPPPQASPIPTTRTPVSRTPADTPRTPADTPHAPPNTQSAPAPAPNSTVRPPAPSTQAPQAASSSAVRLPAPSGHTNSTRNLEPAGSAQSKGQMRTAPINRDSKDATQQFKVIWRDELVEQGRHPSNGAWSAFLASDEGKARLAAHKTAAKHAHG